MRFLFCPGCVLPGAAGGGPAVGQRLGLAGSPLHAMRHRGRVTHRPGPRTRRPGTGARSVSWGGERPARTGGGCHGAARDPGPRTAPDPVPPPPTGRAGAATAGRRGPDVSLGRAARRRGRPRRPGRRPGCGCSSPPRLPGRPGPRRVLVGDRRGRRRPVPPAHRIAKLAEPPTWYIVSTLFGLWGGFFGAARGWPAGCAGTKQLRAGPRPALPLDRPARAPHRGRRPVPGGPHLLPIGPTSTTSTSGSRPRPSG